MRRPVLPWLLALAACTTATERRQGTIVFASGADLQSANPLLTTHPLARQVQRYVLLTTLVRYDSALVVEPYLARAWHWSSDRRTLSMSIFGGLHWHDGVRTSSADVRWTLDAARDPRTGYPRATELDDVTSVSSPDDTTIIIEFATPQDDVPDVFTDLAILPSHLLAGHPVDVLRSAPWNAAPVGNGPFRFVRHEANRRWVFEADPTFPAVLGGPPNISRLVIAVVDEPTTKLAALASGELDFAGINPAHARFVDERRDLTVIDYPLLFSYVMVFNTRRPPFDDPTSRAAVAAALDRAAMVNGFLFGYGTPSASVIPPALGASATVAPQGDSVAASRLLGGRPLEFELLTVGSGEAALEQMIQSQLARIGIRMVIRQVEMTSLLDRVNGSRHDFDAAVMGVPGDRNLRHLQPLLDITGMHRAPGTADSAVIADSLPLVVLYHARGVQGMNRRVRNVHMDLRGELAGIREWRVE